jgi:ATP-dependent Clp protease ATP-binding subunit ClpC
MFERFTDDARRSVVLAQEEARRLNHDHIGTVHILLGLTDATDGLAALALERVGVTAESARREATELVARGTKLPSGHVPFTPGAKRAPERALRQAKARHHRHIGTEHILLSLLDAPDGADDPALRALANLGADADRVRTELSRLMA